MSSRPVVVIPADSPSMVSRSPHLELLKEMADVVLHLDRPLDDDEKVRRLKDADILLNSRSSLKIPRSVLERLPRLKMIAVCGIGYEMIRLCKAIGMSVVAWSLHPDPAKAERLGFRYVTMDELLHTSDAVSLHTRLSEKTHNLISERELAMMKSSAVLINTSRGAVVDSAALVDALNRGALFGAGLDVFDHEPLPADHPILSCEQIVLTPHTADQTQEGIDQLTLGCVANIRAFLDGKPQNVVNPEVLISKSL